jgi:predicted ATPase
MEARPYLREISLRDNTEREQQYPFSIPAIRGMGTITFHPDVTFFVRENGTGKSTLLEAIAVLCGLNAEGGSKNFRFSTRASESDLSGSLRMVRSYRRPRDSFFLRAESFFNLATEVEGLGANEAYGGISLHEQSHGESFMSLLTERFHGNGLYILDEPEAALSPIRQLAMLRRMNQLVRQNSQFIIATHSPILLGYPDCLILQLDDKGLSKIEYEQTGHYTVTRRFMNDYAGMLKELFSGDDDV